MARTNKRTNSDKNTARTRTEEEPPRSTAALTPRVEVRVDSIVVPRAPSPVRLIRIGLLSIVLHYLNRCLVTVGQPRIDAVTSLGLSPTSSLTSVVLTYIVRAIDGKNQIPPKHIPSWSALVGLVVSITVYVIGTIVVPIWYTNIDVLLNYRKFNVGRDDASEEELLDRIKYDAGVHKMPVAVLVSTEKSNAVTGKEGQQRGTHRPITTNEKTLL